MAYLELAVAVGQQQDVNSRRTAEESRTKTIDVVWFIELHIYPCNFIDASLS